MADENTLDAVTSLSQNEDIKNSNHITTEAIQQLSDGIVQLYKPEISGIHEKVSELLRNQNVLRDSTQNELTQLEECSMLNDILEKFDKVKLYSKKLVTMKRDMNNLTERAERTRIRAQKLQLQKEKEELETAKEKERQRKYEKELTAKPAAEYAKDSTQ